MHFLSPSSQGGRLDEPGHGRLSHLPDRDLRLPPLLGRRLRQELVQALLTAVVSPWTHTYLTSFVSTVRFLQNVSFVV